MATVSPMTWNWNWKVAATGVAAVAGWLGLGSPIDMADPSPKPPVSTVSITDARVTAASVLAEEARHLDQHLEAAQVAPSARNLFQFGARPVVRRAVTPAPIVAPAPLPPPPPVPFPLRLTGIAVEIVNGAEKRTAILSGPAGIELAASGEPASPGYRVVDVGDSFAEVERASDGARERLILRP
jgi:hypothetical protein